MTLNREIREPREKGARMSFPRKPESRLFNHEEHEGHEDNETTDERRWTQILN
jgi:hypothetical protein